MKKLLAIGLLSATALTSVANAEDNRYYAQFNLGGSLATKTKYESNGGGHKYSYNGSPGVAPLFGAEVGAKLIDNFRVSASLDYRAYSNDMTGNSSGQQSTLKTTSLATMANAYYDFTQGDGFNPYVTVGLGMANNSQKQEGKGKISGAGFKEKKTNNFAWKLGLGAKYQINNSFDIDLRYQYVDLGKVELGDFYAGSVTTKNTTTKSGKLSANEVLVGVAYKF